MTGPSFDSIEQHDDAIVTRQPWGKPTLEVADVSGVTEAKDPYTQELNQFNEGPPS